MSVDFLQDKIRKLKNPAMLELAPVPAELPAHILAESQDAAAACERFCRELLDGLKGIIPGVRVSFTAFALLGSSGMDVLSKVLRYARDLGYYVVLDGPAVHSPASAQAVAAGILGEGSVYPCDGLIVAAYAGSDVIKPFLPYCKDGKKDIFAVARTANKSAPELQDLLAGSRLVHVACADHVNRYGGDCVGKFGYSRVGILAAASSAESLKNLRGKYPKLFMLLDGYDYPNANAKNCAAAFDKFGHGAAACAGSSICGAWRMAESDGRDYVAHAVAAAERMKKNLTRYTTIL